MSVVEMTGRDDRLTPWKLLVAGFAGAGKTMFASTAPDPLFVFFTAHPKIKSIADRYVPITKLVNEVDANGNLVVAAQDQLKFLVNDLAQKFAAGLEVPYKTLVIDTGDELQRVMKDGRRIRNRGEWGPGDWTWLADAYGAVMNSVIDLPMNIIVLYHLANAQDGQDGSLYRELDVQGKSQNEIAGWFDVVAALDTFETADEQGNIESQRVLLTHSSRVYTWVKDHSGNMPPRWPLSPNFVGDYDRLMEVLRGDQSQVTEDQMHQVIGEIGSVVLGPGPATGAKVPTPSELAAAKVPPKPGPLPVVEPVSEPEPEPEPEPVAEPVVEPVSDEQALVQAKEVLAEVGARYICEFEEADGVCGKAVDDEDVAEVAKLRFKKVLCRDHLKAVMKGYKEFKEVASA